MSIEARFIGKSNVPGRVLHCQVDGDNRVFWQEMPKGEQGDSRPFETPEAAESFMVSTAKILGYSKRVDWRDRDMERVCGGEVTRMLQCCKADAF